MISIRLFQTSFKNSERLQTKIQNRYSTVMLRPFSLMGEIKDWELNSEILLMSEEKSRSVASLSSNKYKHKQTYTNISGPSRQVWAQNMVTVEQRNHIRIVLEIATSLNIGKQ